MFRVFSVFYKVLRNFDPPGVPAGATQKFRIFNHFSSTVTRNSLESLSFLEFMCLIFCVGVVLEFCLEIVFFVALLFVVLFGVFLEFGVFENSTLEFW